MHRFCGARRFVFNVGREQRELAYATTGRSPSYNRQTADLKELRDDPELAPWLKEIPKQILNQALKDLQRAYENFFEGNARYPRYKRRSDSRQSFRVPQHVEVRHLSRKWSEVKLQGLGWVRYRDTRPLGGKIKHATVSLEAGRWHVSIQVEVPDGYDAPNGGPAVGVDRGVVHTLVTSDGAFHDMPGRHAKEDERLFRLERKREHQRRGSRNQRKTKCKIAAIHARRARRRHDFCDKQTTVLATTYGAVFLEALHVKPMTGSARGTIDDPGTNVAAKAGLNRAILESSWGLVGRMLNYKCPWYGSTKIEVEPRFSSQECSRCGFTHKDNRKTQAEFLCIKCGYTDNADLNAAKVILGRGIAILCQIAPAAGSSVAACGDSGLPGSVKQEPESSVRDGLPVVALA